MPPSEIQLIETSRGRIHTASALLATLEVALENLQGKFTRKGMVAFTLTPGLVWSLNCGVTDFSTEVARTRFAELEPTFVKIFGTFQLFQ